MATERRTRLAPEARRKQLIALALAALADEPLEAITIESLAAEAGVSRGLVFYYFGSRSGLHHEIVDTARESMLRATAPHPELPPRERLRDTLSRIVRYAREYRGTFTSLIRGAASGDEEVRRIVEQVRLSQTERVLAVFADLGHPDTPLLRLATRGWVALAEQALVEAPVDEVPDEQLIGFLESSLLAVVGALRPAAVSRLA